MAELFKDFTAPIRVELAREEAAGLIKVIDALNEKVMGDATLMKALDLTVETLELADAAGAKVLMRL